MFFSKGGAEWIVAFLGNPGLKYNGTRHNAGFMAADAMEKKLGVSINKMRFKALTQTADIGGKKVLLMKPQTYMNLSGDAIVQAANFYKVPPERVIVVSDETALPIGRLRIRRGGSAGPISFRAYASVSAISRTRTMTWPIGCFRPSRARTRRIWSLSQKKPPTPLSAISPRVLIAR